MELSIKLVLWIHFVSLALAGCAAFAIPAVFGLAARAEPAQRPVFGLVTRKLAALARMALVLLILSGSYLLWAKYGGFGGLGRWFHLKMGFVVLLAGLAIFNIVNAGWAREGNAAAAARMPVLAKTGSVLLLATVLSAVFAFA